MKTKFSTIFDTIGITCLSFLVIFSWIRFYTRMTILALFSAIPLSLAIGYITFRLLDRHTHYTTLKKEEKQNAIRLLTCLNHMTPTEVVQYFFSACTTNEKAYITTVGIEWHDTTHNLFVPCFSGKTLNKSTVLSCLDWAYTHQIDKVIFCYDTIDNSVINYSKEFAVHSEFWDIARLYKEKGAHLPMPLCPHLTLSKLSKRKMLSNIFSNLRVKNFLLFGGFTIAFSYLVPFKMYYLLSGTLLISFALFLLIFRQIKSNQN